MQNPTTSVYQPSRLLIFVYLIALGVGFLVNKNSAADIEEYYSINEKVASLANKLNKRHKFKVVQGYAPTFSHDDQLIERFYEDVESVMAKVKMQYTIVMGDFNAKAGKKQVGHKAIRNYGVGCRIEREDLVVEFTERINVSIINKCKTAGIRKYDVVRIEHALKNGRSLKL